MKRVEQAFMPSFPTEILSGGGGAGIYACGEEADNAASAAEVKLRKADPEELSKLPSDGVSKKMTSEAKA